MMKNSINLIFLSVLLCGCYSKNVEVINASAHNIEGPEGWTIKLNVSEVKPDDLVWDGDVAYLHVFECGEQDNFMVFGNPSFIEYWSGTVIVYEIGREAFLDRLIVMCGQYITTGYALGKVRSQVFHLN